MAAKKTVSKPEIKAAKKTKTAAGASMEQLIDMDEAIEMLKTSRSTFYRWLRSGEIKGIKAGRQWRFERTEIERFLKGEAPRIELRADIDPFIDALAGHLNDLGTTRPAPEKEKVAEAVALMIRLGVALNAGDIHIETLWNPDTGSAEGLLRFRVDGVMTMPVTLDIRLVPAVIERWKLMASCDAHERMRPQDGRILVKFGEQSYDLRINFFPVCLGENLTARILYPGTGSLDLADIPYPAQVRERLITALNASAGLIVFAGPLGSGTTTSVYAGLKHLAAPGRKLISIENPIELFLPGISQAQVHPGRDITFPYLLRAAFRSDPDILAVSTLRDRETLTLTLEAALTGHLVLTAMPSRDAAQTLTAIMDLGTEPFLAADAVRLIVAQRLIRLLCPACSTAAAPAAHIRDGLQAILAPSERDLLDSGNFRKPVGCPRCRQTGYRGRTIIAEALALTPALRSLISKGADAESIREQAVKEGMITMAAHGVKTAAAGETSLEEIVRVLGA